MDSLGGDVGSLPGPLPGIAARRSRLALALAGVTLLGIALAAKPAPFGDALEYLLQTESLARHGTPEVRADDVLSVARQAERLELPLNLAAGYQGYLDTPSGRWYACHFWGYSLLAVPMRLLLGLVGLGGLRAFPVMNALALLLALHHILFLTPFGARWRAILASLLVTSPALYFVRWPHAEVMTVAATTLALTMRYAGRPHRALLWAALASLQAPSFAILVALLWIDAIAKDPHWSRAWRATAAASLALLAPLFYLRHFGTPSLLARESASLANVSAHRAAELFLDPNIGLVRAMPVTVILLAIGAGRALCRARTLPFEAASSAATVLVALACTPTDNWNHSTVGPSRYAVWLVPCVLFVVVRVAERTASRAGTVWTAALVAAAVVQLVLVAAAGGPFARPDDLRHSRAARLLLRHAPALYRPDPATFAARTLQRPNPPVGLVVYEDGGRCRKALVRPADEPGLLERCGFVPASGRALLASGGEAARYVDY